MTLAVLHKNDMLGSILNRYIAKRGDWIPKPRAESSASTIEKYYA